MVVGGVDLLVFRQGVLDFLSASSFTRTFQVHQCSGLDRAVIEHMSYVYLTLTTCVQLMPAPRAELLAVPESVVLESAREQSTRHHGGTECNGGRCDARACLSQARLSLLTVFVSWSVLQAHWLRRLALATGHAGRWEC